MFTNDSQVKRSTAAPNLVAISDNNSDDDPVDVPLCAATGPNAQHMFVWPDIAGSTCMSVTRIHAVLSVLSFFDGDILCFGQMMDGG
eukprot:SAG31_NODE_1131_length_9748_cov_3.466473_6_plen_87_part_00